MSVFSKKQNLKPAIDILKKAIEDSYRALDPDVEIKEEEAILKIVYAVIWFSFKKILFFTFTRKTLVSKLDGYRGFIAPISQTQKTAYIYKTSVVDSLSAAFISTNWSQSSSWASGRYPYEFIVRATINGESKTLFLLNIHAKALSDVDSYNRRFDDIAELKDLLYAQRSASNLIFMGDFNCPQSHTVFAPLKKMGYSSSLVNQKTSLRQKCIQNDCLASEYDTMFFNPQKIKIIQSGVIPFYKNFVFVHCFLFWQN